MLVDIIKTHERSKNVPYSQVIPVVCGIFLLYHFLGAARFVWTTSILKQMIQSATRQV